MSRYLFELAATGLVAPVTRPQATWLEAETLAGSATGSLRAAPAPRPIRHVHRDRAFGVGYGNSSGYAADRHYVREWLPPRFRCF